MKLFIKIVAVVTILPLFTGCNDFLDKDIQGNSTDENYYDTAYKLQAGLDAVYNVLQSDDFNECEWRFGEATADNGHGTDEGLSSQMGQLVQFRFNTSNTWIKLRYSVNYKGIHLANEVIANADRVKLSVNNYASYKGIREILGQAKFLRALFYFNLVKTYGGVPIRPEVETVDNLVIPRSSAADVYAYIEKDLREAAIMLPAKYIEGNSGKASEGAVLGLLMKVLMYQTTPGAKSEQWEDVIKLGKFFEEGGSMTFGEILKYDSDKEDWDALRLRLLFQPKEYMQADDPYETKDTQVTSMVNAYGLDYTDCYGKPLGSYIDQFNLDGEFCKGSLFEVVFKESADGTTGDTNEGSAVFSNLFDSVLFRADAATVDEIFGNDPRRTFILTHQQFTPDGYVLGCGPGNYLSLKWYTPLKERPQYAGDNAKNRRLLRYADVVLMYAEGLNEMGLGNEALTVLNKAKAMANTITGGTTLYIAGGYGYMRDQIWKERRIEFCYEWDRFFDLVRQKRAATVIKTYGSKYAIKRGAFFREGVNELFPIPQNEIDISNGVVTQNPGY